MRIAIVTSGGDAPGMNAAIRAVVRTAVSKRWDVIGVKKGYEGLISGNYSPLGIRDVGNIIGIGGTLLGSSRSQEFKTPEGRKIAIDQLKKHNIDALVVIGGNGTQKGTYELHQMGYPVIGIASTIDNDLYGTDISIGVDTALNVALEAIDRIKVTASSHNRIFAIEVMGRDFGYLALMAGIAGGAESIIIPEAEPSIDEIVSTIKRSYNNGKPHVIIVVAEGAKYNADGLTKFFNDKNIETGFELRTTVLGYVQRGAAPGIFDRILATRFGAAAVDCIEKKQFGILTGMQKGEIICTPLKEVVTNRKQLDLELLKLADVLAR